ncbi:(2Fe-2S)-binding protein [Mycolicibacterium flavescens]|uniref:Iron reductase n=1 Tax=Mycolicibacterium flavescens TaxID=1776 RepID=A0A1E3RA83_MYCFV|nr:(2Fe-2S)-binding protein [Mycolicibacterium flavescens]MCV7283613.1 (2Fe-2S)-binding protein [Mycolicibacterium flavescens]ODQ86826.1 iron reductase [Mycolicibacterium flavescens]
MRITDELGDVAKLGGFFAIGVGEPPGRWQPIERFYTDGFADLITRTAEGRGAGALRVSASLVQFSIASRLWSPALACAVMHGVAPDFVGLQRAGDSADLAIVEPTGVRGSESELVEVLYEAVVQRHLEPLGAGLGVKLAPGLLYGNVASAMVAATRALYSARPRLRDPATRLARALLDTGKLTGTGTVKYNLAFRRRSCCLYYRIADGAKCGDCGLTRPAR